MRGVVYVVYGINAKREAKESIRTLHEVWPEAPVVVIGEAVEGAGRVIKWPNRDGYGRWAKVNLYDLSPFEETLYLDADTRVYGNVGIGFEILDDGFDIVIVPSKCRGTDWLWHVTQEERNATRTEMGGQLLTLGGGVIWFGKNERTIALFAAWREEWLRWQGQDQGALTRAYAAKPCRIWLLSRAWNGGNAIGHRFGTAKVRG